MATQIHGAGPLGERSPGLDAAIAAWHAENPDTGGSTLTATDAPTAPAEGTSASYLVSSAVTWPAGLVWSTDPDGGTAPTITDYALVSLFTLGGVTRAVMGATFPTPVVPDTTDPTPGTLGVVTGSTTADLTVTGATDETALAAAPYAYSSDNGATWSAYQAGATYQFTGLTASTSYTFQHRVKDAAGNVATGTAVTESTDAPSSDTTPPTAGTLAASSITDTGFTLTVSGASDETALHATPYAFSTDNGVTYSAWQTGATYNATGLAASTGYQARHKVRDAALNEATGTAITVTTTSSVWAPNSIADLEGWWDPSDAATVTETSGSVSQVSDKSGKGHHLAQATSTMRPTLAALNGLNAMSFDGGDKLTAATGLAMNSGLAYTVAVVATPSSVASKYLFELSSGTHAHALISNFGSLAYEVYNVEANTAKGRYTLAASASGAHVLTSTRSGTGGVTLTGSYDGAAVTGVTVSSSASLGTTWNANVGGSKTADYATATIAEIVVYNRALTAGELADLNTYLKTKWGIA